MKKWLIGGGIIAVVVAVVLFSARTELFQGRLSLGSLKGGQVVPVRVTAETSFSNREYIPGLDNVWTASWKLTAGQAVEIYALGLTINTAHTNYIYSNSVLYRRPGDANNNYFGYIAQMQSRTIGSSGQGALVINKDYPIVMAARESITVNILTNIIGVGYPTLPQNVRVSLVALGKTLSPQTAFVTPSVASNGFTVRNPRVLEVISRDTFNRDTDSDDLPFHPNAENYVMGFVAASSDASMHLTRVRVRLEGNVANVASVRLMTNNGVQFGSTAMLESGSGSADFHFNAPLQQGWRGVANFYILAQGTPEGVVVPGDRLRFSVTEVDGVSATSAETAASREPVYGSYLTVQTPVNEERCRQIRQWLNEGQTISDDHADALADYNACNIQRPDIMYSGGGEV